MMNLADGGACARCTTNCLLVHRNPMDPSVNRFFKVLLGRDISQLMLVPPRVAREKKWRKYINTEAYLEDTIGDIYPVKISEVEKDVVFKEGWCRFSSEHNLEEGDFVVFTQLPHVEKLHLVVHIYGTSGKEKLCFLRGKYKNLSITNRSPSSSGVRKPLCSDIHDQFTTSNHTGSKCTDGEKLQYAAPWDIDSIHMLNRDIQFTDDKTWLYDLSSFEKQEDHTAEVEVSIKDDEVGTMKHSEKIIESQTDLALQDMLPVKRRFSSLEPQPYKKQNVSIENPIDDAPVNVAPEVKMAVNDGERSSPYVPKMAVRRDRTCSADSVLVQRDVLTSDRTTGEAIKTPKMELDIGVKTQTIIPKNIRSSSSNVKKDVKIPKTGIRSEILSSLLVGRETSSAVVDDKPYLLLQSHLPSVPLHKEKLRMIYLRAPDSKVLPVIYQQRKCVGVLTSGWDVFKSMYHLEAGYICHIELEDAFKRIYKFKVTSK